MTTNKTQPSWVTHSTDIVYDNPWITVSHRNVTAPTGKDAIYGMVHFKNVAVAVIPIDEEGYTWLVGQHRYTLDCYSWEVPEGGSHLTESTLEAAKRELLEETGIVAEHWQELLQLHTSNSVTDERAIAYIARGLSFNEAEPDDTEVLERQRVPITTAIEMAMDGRITDALAMASLFKIKIMMDQQALSE